MTMATKREQAKKRQGRDGAPRSGVGVEWLEPTYQREDDIIRDYAVFFPGNIVPGRTMPNRGPKSWLDVFKKNFAVSSCVRLIATSMLANGWELVANDEDGENETERAQIEEFFANCHPYYSFNEILYEALETVVLANHAYVEVVDNAIGQPAQLWNLPLANIIPRTDAQGYFRDDGAFVQVNDPRNPGTWTRFDWANVLWLRFPGVRSGGVNPMSPIEMLELPTSSAIESERYIHSFFASGGKFGMIIENEQWDQAQAEEARRYYERLYSDSSYGHRMMFLYDGSTLKEPPRQFWRWGELIDVQSFDGRKVCGVFGVDPRLIGYPGEGNLGGKGEREQAYNELFSKTVNPRAAIVSEIVTKQLLVQRFGITGWRWRLKPYRVDLDEGSRQTLAATYETMARTGLLNPRDVSDANVARAELNANLRELTEEDVKAVPLPPPTSVPREEERRAPRSVYEKRTPYREIEQRMRKWEDETIEALGDPLRVSAEKAMDKVADLYQAGKVQEVKTANLLPGAGGLPVEYRKRLKAHYRDSYDDARDEISRYAKNRAIAMRKVAGDSISEAGPGDIDDFIELFGTTEFDALYARVVHEQRDTFLEGLRSGWPRKEFVEHLRENVMDVIDNDLSTMVRTSATEFFNLARQRAADESGIVEGYEFSAIIDDRTTEVCQALDGLQIAATAPEVDRISPPLHYNCRSVLNFILTDEPLEFDRRQLDRGMRLIHEGFGKRRRKG